MSITVTSMTKIQGSPPDNTSVHLARCTFQLEGLVSIPNCLLVETRKWGRTIWAPKVASGGAEAPANVKMTDELRAACTEAACAVYDAIGEAQKRGGPVLSAAVALVQELEARGQQ